MMDQLPEQEEKAGTYMELPLLEYFIKTKLIEENREDQLPRIWCAIIHVHFPLQDGLCTGPLIEGDSDLFYMQLVEDIKKQMELNSPVKEKNFVVVELWASGQEDRQSIWEQAIEQLGKRLPDNNNSKRHYRQFGAVAVGSLVRFFELVNGGLVNLEQDGTAYRLDLQCKTIVAKLAYIRQNFS